MIKKKVLVWTAALATALTVPAFAVSAADYLPKDIENGGGNVVVSGDTPYNNLYVGGGSVIINQNIRGDLFSFGGSVSVSAPVDEDLFAAGGNVTINSPVGDDVRAAGGNLSLSAPVAGDALVSGGTLTLSKDASIGGDLWAAGGTVSVTGPVAGNAKIAGGEVYINSAIDGMLEVWSDASLVFGPEANVPGPIIHKGWKDAVVEEGAQIGTIEFSKNERKEKNDDKGAWVGFAVGAFVFYILTLFVTAFVALYLLRKPARDIVDLQMNSFLKNLLYGVVAVIVIPVLSFVLMLTVLGAYMGAILIAFFVLALMVSGVFNTLVIGARVEGWIKKTKKTDLTWKTVIWGAVVIAAVSLVPVVGALVIAVIFLATFGAFLRTGKSYVSK